MFGSELKVLFAHPAVERRFTSEGLFHQLMQTMVPGTSLRRASGEARYVLKVQRVNGHLEVSESIYWDVDFRARTSGPQANRSRPHRCRSCCIAGGC